MQRSALLDDPQPVLGGELAPGGLGHDLRVRCPARLSGLDLGGLVAPLLAPQDRRVGVHFRWVDGKSPDLKDTGESDATSGTD